jgi:hypothetical protein
LQGRFGRPDQTSFGRLRGGGESKSDLADLGQPFPVDAGSIRTLVLEQATRKA